MTVITVSGPPGSGTSTVCRLLEERTVSSYVYAGQIFRDLARERGISLLEFGELCEKDPTIDRELDDRMMELARSGEDLILEGRMTGALCFKEDIDSFRIYIDADPRIRAERVMERDGGDVDTVIREMKEREDSERNRYRNYYGMDPTDGRYYDLVVDSTHITPEEEVEIILRGMDGNLR